MAGKMLDYLSEVTADYVYTLDITPTNMMVESGDKKQAVHEFDDGSIAVVSKSTKSYFDITLQFDLLTSAESEEILDVWHNTSKANGMENTIYWKHPIELDFYTARFMSIAKKTYHHRNGSYPSISGINLRVEGKAPAGVS